MMTLTRAADFSATHAEPLLPSWHPCARMHGHQWTAALEVSSQEDLTADEAVRIHTAFAEFDAWVAERLNRRHLNAVDPALQEHSGPDTLARWIYQTWQDRLPHLASVRVSGPLKEDTGGPARYERYEVAYPQPPTAA